MGKTTSKSINKMLDPKLLFSIISFFIFSTKCYCQISNSIDGLFISQNDTDYLLNVSAGKFSLIHLGTSLGIMGSYYDTIAYGVAKKNCDGYLELTTDSYWPKKWTFKAAKNHTTDSLIFHIHSPIDEYYKESGRIDSALTYSIFIERDKVNSVSPEASPRFIGGEYEMLNLPGYDIKDIRIEIHPTYKIPLKNISQYSVVVMNENIMESGDNEFDINLPSLTFKYFSLKRFRGKYAKIIDARTIIFEGITYIKRSSLSINQSSIVSNK
jgi:hypothetical protein